MKLKDKKIEILAEQTVKDADGFAAKTFVPIHGGKLWAYFRQLSGDEVYSAMAAHVTEQALFQINYRADVTTANAVRYGGRLYDIARVDPFEGGKNDLTLFCKLREA
jgi:SPP1 family predicted phage head-tail adaptor